MASTVPTSISAHPRRERSPRFTTARAARARLGSNISEISAVEPCSIEPKIPLQVTSGDVIQLPIAMINGMSRELRGAEVTASGPGGIKFTLSGDNRATLRSKERTRRFVQVDVGQFTGVAKLTFDAKAGSYRDSV